MYNTFQPSTGSNLGTDKVQNKLMENENKRQLVTLRSESHFFFLHQMKSEIKSSYDSTKRK